MTWPYAFLVQIPHIEGLTLSSSHFWEINSLLPHAYASLITMLKVIISLVVFSAQVDKLAALQYQTLCKLTSTSKYQAARSLVLHHWLKTN